MACRTCFRVKYAAIILLALPVWVHFSNSSANWLACRVGLVVLCRVPAVAEAVASEDLNSEVIQSPNRSGRHDRAVFIVNAKCCRIDAIPIAYDLRRIRIVGYTAIKKQRVECA
jgi:hypothetical protein